MQARYVWSEIGDDGVLIGDADEPHVFKFGGFDANAVALDTLGAHFGFITTNAQIVGQDDADVAAALAHLDENHQRIAVAKDATKILKMDRLPGRPLHEADLGGDAGKAATMCGDLGRMVVMDLLTRNNDRVDLTRLDEMLLATDTEQKLDGEGWRPWMANEGNMIVDETTGHANPIDSQFTEASDEAGYASNVARVLTDERLLAELVGAVADTVEGVGLPVDRVAIRDGIQAGKTQLIG